MEKTECKRCGESKAPEDMLQRRGKPSKVCLECWGASRRKGGKKSKRAKTPRRVRSLEEVVERRANGNGQPKPVELGKSLEVLPGYGFRAAIEDDRLAIEQDSGERTDNVTLSKAEARALFAQFGEWASA